MTLLTHALNGWNWRWSAYCRLASLFSLWAVVLLLHLPATVILVVAGARALFSLLNPASM